MPKRLIAITGATGRVGPFVARELLARGHSLRLLARQPGEARRLFGDWLGKARVEIAPTDLVQVTEEQLVRRLDGCDAVVHLAALVDTDYPWEAFMLANYEVTRRLCAAARKAGVRRFVHASSTSVYGNPRRRDVPESAPLKPVSPYGWSKLFAEDAVKRCGLEWVILRPSVVYGPGVEEGFAPAARAVLKGRMRLIGSGGNVIPLVHARDLARAFALAVESPRAAREVFNVAGPEATQRQLLGWLAEALAAPPVERSTPRWLAYLGALAEEARAKLSRRPPKVRREHVRVFGEDRSFSTRRIERVLGWRARVSPREGVREFAGWFRAHARH
jgi:nucleoside-diphosphate-sugar epimerase